MLPNQLEANVRECLCAQLGGEGFNVLVGSIRARQQQWRRRWRHIIFPSYGDVNFNFRFNCSIKWNKNTLRIPYHFV